MSADIVNFDRRPLAEEEARKWIVRIDAGPLTADERVELRAWLAEDATHVRLLDEHALLWAAASRARFPSPTVETASRPTWPQGEGERRPLRWLAVSTALVAVALISAPALRDNFWPTRDTGTVVAMSTEVGERRPVALPDGSRTEMNAHTSMRVAYGVDRRRVFLDYGESLFEVAKDKTRPFEVVAGDTTVRAVGTRFLVERHGDGRVEVTVYEGVVEVTRQGRGPVQRASSAAPNAAPEPMRLGVGQIAISGSDHTLVAVAEGRSMARKLAWQAGRLEFDQTPLSEVIEEVNRYSPLPVRLASEALQGIRVSGSFSTQNTDVLLRSLEQGFGFKVQRTSDGWLLSKVN